MTNLITVTLDQAAKFYACANLALNFSLKNLPNTAIRNGTTVPVAAEGCDLIWNECSQRFETDTQYHGLQVEYHWWKKKLKNKSMQKAAQLRYNFMIV